MLDVTLHTRPVNPRLDTLDPEQQPPTQVVEDKLIRVEPGSLLCSLQHEVTAVDISDIYGERQ